MGGTQARDFLAPSQPEQVLVECIRKMARQFKSRMEAFESLIWMVQLFALNNGVASYNDLPCSSSSGERKTRYRLEAMLLSAVVSSGDSGVAGGSRSGSNY